MKLLSSVCLNKLRLLSFSIIGGTFFNTYFTSPSEFRYPKVNLIVPFAVSESRPIASNTWEGSSEPDEQALPADAAIPCISSINNNVSDSTPLKLTLMLLGSLSSGWPFKTVSGIFNNPSISSSRSNLSLFVSFGLNLSRLQPLSRCLRYLRCFRFPLAFLFPAPRLL